MEVGGDLVVRMEVREVLVLCDISGAGERLGFVIGRKGRFVRLSTSSAIGLLHIHVKTHSSERIVIKGDDEWKKSRKRLTAVRSPNTHQPPSPPAIRLSKSLSLPPFNFFCNNKNTL